VTIKKKGVLNLKLFLYLLVLFFVIMINYFFISYTLWVLDFFNDQTIIFIDSSHMILSVNSVLIRKSKDLQWKNKFLDRKFKPVLKKSL
jgi:hypothetical protein